jgi:hypothetical protein
MTGIERIREEYMQALDRGQGVIDLGRTVACDACDTDLTGDPRSGGYLFGSYAYGPCCADERLASIRGYGEEGHIRAWCPEGVSFADWCRSMRTGPGGNEIRVTPLRRQP